MYDHFQDLEIIKEKEGGKNKILWKNPLFTRNTLFLHFVRQSNGRRGISERPNHCIHWYPKFARFYLVLRITFTALKFPEESYTETKTLCLAKDRAGQMESDRTSNEPPRDRTYDKTVYSKHSVTLQFYRQ